MTASKVDCIVIEFPGATPAEAAILAQECASKLREAGVPGANIQIARSAQEAMDLGGVLLILGSLGFTLIQEAVKGVGWEIGKAAGDAASKAIEKLPAAIESVLEAISRRHRTPIQIKGGDGKTWTMGREFQSTSPSGLAGSGLGTVGIVILGASEFPYMNDPTLNNGAFARSAGLARTLFSPPHTAFAKAEVLDLFDKEMQPLEVLDAIEQHIDAHPDMHDLLIYYCGHGSFQKDNTYFMTLRATRAGREATTGLAPRAFRQDLETRLFDKRVYFVIDCCFSGAFVESLQSADALERVVEDQLNLDMPQRGWTVLTASAKDKVAMAPKGENYTMFTGALAHVIENGTSVAGLRFNFRDLADQAQDYIKRYWKRQAVLPRCFSPEQPEGDIARLPIFLNSYREQTEAKPVESPAYESATHENATEGAGMEREASELHSAGLTAEHIREAKELANWNFVKDRRNIADLRDHIARFPGGGTELYARAQLEALIWDQPATQASMTALQSFLDEFPQGDQAGTARARLEAMKSEEAMRLAKKKQACREGILGEDRQER